MPETKPKILITFDLDDTLWALTPIMRAAMKKQRAWLVDNCPVAVPFFDDERLRERIYRKLVHRDPDLQNHLFELRCLSYHETFRMARLAEEDAERLTGQLARQFLVWRNTVTPYPQAMELVQALHGRAVLGTLTNGNADLTKIGMDAHFDFSITASDVNCRKPGAAIFARAMALAHVQDPALCCHIGDAADADMRGARQQGWHSLWVNCGSEPWPLGGDAPPQVPHLAVDTTMPHLRRLFPAHL